MSRKEKRKSTNNGSHRKGKCVVDEQPTAAIGEANRNITSDDLNGIKCWIESLTFEKLIESLEFAFQSDKQPVRLSCHTRRQQQHQQQHVEPYASQDFDLLIKMASLQCANLNGCGYERRRHLMMQLENLCLFRLVDPTNAQSKVDFVSKPTPSDDYKEGGIFQAASRLPAELLDVLAQAGVKRSSSDLLETFNEVDKLDNTFDSLEATEEELHAPFVKYEIEIHKGIAHDGMMLELGSTSEQQTADRLMLLRTVLISDLLLHNSNGEMSSSSGLPQCKLHYGKFKSDSLDQKMELLDLLRVTSRGKFLSATGERNEANRAPWFEPTQRWFSLPMYLASRYEAALWDTYFSTTKTDERNKEPKVNLLKQSVENLDREGVGRVLSHAFGTAVKNEMIEMRHKLPADSSSFDATIFVDNLLRKLLNRANDCGNESPINERLEYLSVSPLLNWGTPSVELKALAMRYIREGVSCEAEKSLIRSLSAEDNRAKIKKKRKTSRKKRLNHHQPEILSTLEEEQSEEEQESEEDDPFIEAILSNTTSGIISDSNGIGIVNHTTNNSDTIEKMIILQVIDDILTTVFHRLGMEKDTSDNFSEAVLVTSHSDTCQKEDVNNENDIEVATTAIVSNKADASVDAALKFLRRKDADVSSQSHSPKRSQQLWASRARREPQEVTQQSGLKRCLSSGAQAADSALNTPPHQSQPHRSHYRSSSLNHSAAISKNFTSDSASTITYLLDLESSSTRLENNVANTASSVAASIALSRLDLEDPGLDIDGEFQDPTEQAHQRPNSGDGVGLPPTPPLTQTSSFVLSSSDIGKLRLDTPAEHKTNGEGVSPSPLSMSSPVKVARLRTMTTSLSRDDLRSIDERFKLPRRNRDDHHTMGHRQVDALLSYRNAVAQSSVPRKPVSDQSHDGKQKNNDTRPMIPRIVKSTLTGLWTPGDFPSLSSSVASIHSYREPMINKILHLDLACARSESALDADGAEDASHCNVIPTHHDDTITKDGATTISSVHSVSDAIPERLVQSLKEERNSYRDICLTLGAENAKLRNLLASKMCAPLYHPPQFAAESQGSYYQQNLSYDHQFTPSYHQNMSMYNVGANFTTQPIAAMSDAGLHRGDYDSSAMSEDGTDFHPSVVGFSEGQNSISWQPRGDSVQSFSRRTSVGGTYADSDMSLEYIAGGPGFHRIHYQDSFFGSIPLHGIQSRLSKDIDRYMLSLKTQLKKNEHRRTFAVDQITKAVKALWPRAQIKMYGSHVTKLCLPSSDMDFVICLPAVHKNAPAMTPGDLEGRNAINETNQKILARKLKGENWLDQRSIKVIERTAVPVIKVSTKGSRSRIVQLDLSFDAKEHHGLEALDMIRHILEEIPMIRPLVLVLKQFLLDRGLLTAYTGGLSSYCLFLMVARYCQEQCPTWNDRGSLLMGLLDFYGNFFDPRTTGISVRSRRYFSRFDENHFPDTARRNNVATKPPRFQPLSRQSSFRTAEANQLQSGKFDPMWVEDPLNPGNNVGRNAFRIFQVQRAFSDAHRALVAALEWDINSMNEFGEDGEYPLLKCLLQNEDLFPMDDPAPHMSTSLGAKIPPE